MLRKKALKKIYLTTLFLFIMLITLTFNYFKKDKSINIMEVEYTSNFNTTHIYLLNSDNLLVKVDYLLRRDNIKDNIYDVLNELYVNNKKDSSLRGTIPSNTKIKQIDLNNSLVTIDFSSDLLKVNEKMEEKVIESIVYSLIEFPSIKNVKILIDGQELKKLEKSNKSLPILLNESIGINKTYSLNNLKDIEKVIIYYVCNISENEYYVPVTKYLNSRDDKIKIIIDSLKSNYYSNTNLKSYLNSKSKIDFQLDNDILTLTFDSLNDDNLESVTYSLASSIFDSTNIKKVIFEVNSKIVDVKNKLLLN